MIVHSSILIVDIDVRQFKTNGKHSSFWKIGQKETQFIDKIGIQLLFI